MVANEDVGDGGESAHAQRHEEAREARVPQEVVGHMLVGLELRRDLRVPAHAVTVQRTDRPRPRPIK